MAKTVMLGILLCGVVRAASVVDLCAPGASHVAVVGIKLSLLAEVRTILQIVDEKTDYEAILKTNPTDKPGAVQSRLIKKLTGLSPEHLKQTYPDFQKAVGLLKTWQTQEKPFAIDPELIRKRVLPLIAALQDKMLNPAEVASLHNGIMQEQEGLNVLRARSEGEGNYVRSRLRREADDGQILAAVDGNAANVLGGDGKRNPR